MPQMSAQTNLQSASTNAMKTTDRVEPFVVVTVVGPSILNRCLKDTWSWRVCHQLHHK